MIHLTMDQLLALTEPATEPGHAAAASHLESCASCQAELERLHQRRARIRALPTLRPERDRWPAIQAEIRSARRRRLSVGVMGSLALAASVALLVFVSDRQTDSPVVPTPQAEIEAAMMQSQLLERALAEFAPERRVTDGHTAGVVAELEDRISALDEELQVFQLRPEPTAGTAVLQLWRERVGLMDALVDVHLTRASNVGL